MIAAIVWLLFDLHHCARWQSTPHGPRCADIRLGARCIYPGWHVVHKGVPVCSSQCGDEAPTT